jgi:hypothetical protein
MTFIAYWSFSLRPSTKEAAYFVIGYYKGGKTIQESLHRERWTVDTSYSYSHFGQSLPTMKLLVNDYSFPVRVGNLEVLSDLAITIFPGCP